MSSQGSEAGDKTLDAEKNPQNPAAPNHLSTMGTSVDTTGDTVPTVQIPTTFNAALAHSSTAPPAASSSTAVGETQRYQIPTKPITMGAPSNASALPNRNPPAGHQMQRSNAPSIGQAVGGSHVVAAGKAAEVKRQTTTAPQHTSGQPTQQSTSDRGTSPPKSSSTGKQSAVGQPSQQTAPARTNEWASSTQPSYGGEQSTTRQPAYQSDPARSKEWAASVKRSSEGTLAHASPESVPKASKQHVRSSNAVGHQENQRSVSPATSSRSQSAPWSVPRNFTNTNPPHGTQQHNAGSNAAPVGLNRSTHAPQHRTDPRWASNPPEGSSAFNASHENVLVNNLTTQNAIAIAWACATSAPTGPPRNSPGSVERSVAYAIQNQQIAGQANAQRRTSTSNQQGTGKPNIVRYSPIAKSAPMGEGTDTKGGSSSQQAEQYLRRQYATSHGGFPQEANQPQHRTEGPPNQNERGSVSVPALYVETTSLLKRDDAARSTLVRKLVGDVPVEGNECPIILDPALIVSLADKIRMVIAKIVNIQVAPLKNTKKRSSSEMGRDQQVIDLSEEDSEQPFTQRLKELAVQQSELLEEERAQVARLRRSLAEKDEIIAEQAREASYMQNQSHAEEISATVRNLIRQLDDAMHTGKRQKQEILSMRTVINQDAADLEEKQGVIEDLRQKLRERAPDTELPPEAAIKVHQLEGEVKAISETLDRERRQNESDARSYMRAAVHSVKIHNRLLAKHASNDNAKR